MNLFKSYTSRIILANVIVYLAFSIASAIFGETKLLELLALQPSSIIAGHKLWTPFTSIFLHASLFHLFVNMFSLFFLGKRLFNYTLFKSGGLEDIVGKKRFLIFYLLSGLFASVFFALLSGFFGHGYFGQNILGDPNILGLGASGAIFGLLGLLAIIMPNKKVFFIAGPLIALILDSILSNIIPDSLAGILSIAISLYILFSIFAMFNQRLRKFAIPIELSFWILPVVAIVPLVIIDLIPGIDLPIGNMAHLGGLILGLCFGYYLKKKFPNKTKLLDRMFSQ